MADFSSARKAMVDNQVATSGVTDSRLLSVLRRVPREIFLPADRAVLAYTDAHHPFGHGRFLSAPAVFARLVQLAGITKTDRVLDCWPSTGYSAAVLAELAREVTAIEPDAALAATARSNLARLGIANTTIIEGQVKAPSVSSWDVIMVEGALLQSPDDLLPGLAMGGRLVCLLRNGPVGTATIYTHSPQGITARSGFNATLPPADPRPAPEIFVF